MPTYLLNKVPECLHQHVDADWCSGGEGRGGEMDGIVGPVIDLRSSRWSLPDRNNCNMDPDSDSDSDSDSRVRNLLLACGSDSTFPPATEV